MLCINGTNASLIAALLENSEVKLLYSKNNTGTLELDVKPMVPVFLLADRANVNESGCMLTISSGSNYRKNDGVYVFGYLSGFTRGDTEIIIPTANKLVLNISKMTTCVLHVFQ